ncbi:MAG: cob(I)yrinic acid a,c-diamide adenosyltransferase [Pseudomonadota bacterium]
MPLQFRAAIFYKENLKRSEETIMADRLTVITTRGGDQGETSLGDGTRVPKTHARVGLLGSVDSLNSWIGVVLSHLPGEAVRETLEGVQHDLFDLGGCLCFPGTALLSEAHVLRLDQASASMNEALAPLKEFILPGGSPLLAWLHVARTQVRETERDFVAFDQEPEDHVKFARQYLNRLSDFLFIAARAEARRTGVQETLWEKGKSVS